jgi:hypothetical protein
MMQTIELEEAPFEHRGGLNSANTVKVVKAHPDDFERVYPLLQDFGISRLTKDHWLRLFTKNWDSAEAHCGYLLEQGGEVKGFLGLLFSERTIKGRLEKFCNLTSWMVKQESRPHSLQLLLEALKLRDCTFTNFTPSTGVASILKKLGFIELQSSEQILLPVPGFSYQRTSYRCLVDLGEIQERLSEADRKIFTDHRDLDCRHVLISDGEKYCYLILKTRSYKRLPFARVHYLSNPELFASSIDALRTNLCWRLKVAGLMVENRYVGGRAFSYSRNYPQQCPAFFKSDSVGPGDIDTLYSEMILLHD